MHLVYFNADVDNSALQKSGSLSRHRGGSEGGMEEGDGGGGLGEGGGGDGDGGGGEGGGGDEGGDSLQT